MICSAWTADSELKLWSLIAQSPPGVRWISRLGKCRASICSASSSSISRPLASGANLSFQPEQIRELALLLNGEQLTRLDTTECCRRTEGWIAGIKLALLDYAAVDPSDALNHDVVSYLQSAAWESLSEALREALLATCICNRFCAELMDALTGAAGAARLLEQLERQQLFPAAAGKHR